jgi:F-type H+-transporting ATPase subunit b
MTTHHALVEMTGSHVRGAAAAGGVNLDFDLTFLIQMVAFTLLVLILKPLLFDPLMSLFAERERCTEGAKLSARQMDERAGELLRRYEAELEKVRRIAGEERERLRSEGQRLEAKIVEEARAEVAKTIDDGKAAITRESATIRAELHVRSQQLGRSIASSVLGREIT